MNRILSTLIIMSLSTQAISASKDIDHSSLFIGCHSVQPEIKYDCIKNSHNLIKSQINKKIRDLKERDRAHLLNTKALSLEQLKSKCDDKSLSRETVLSCKVNADIALLNYIDARY